MTAAAADQLILVDEAKSIEYAHLPCAAGDLTPLSDGDCGLELLLI